MRCGEVALAPITAIADTCVHGLLPYTAGYHIRCVCFARMSLAIPGPWKWPSACSASTACVRVNLQDSSLVVDLVLQCASVG
jgi:hypothetical protein